MNKKIRAKLSIGLGAAAFLAASAITSVSVANEVKVAATTPHGAPAKPAHGSSKSSAKSHGAVLWGYSGKGGPEKWGDLTPANKVCG
jgi:carbonic anhydrase